MTLSADNSISAAWDNAFRLPDRREIWEYAADTLTLPGTLAESGRFDVETKSRHFKQVFQWLRSDEVREVFILAPPREGKTLFVDLFVPWVIENAPGPMMVVFNNEDLAREHAESRTWPILQSSESIRRMMPADTDKIRAMEIILPHMPVYFKPALKKHLQAKGIRYTVGDECWLWPPGVMAELKARSEDFAKLKNEKRIWLSQGGPDDSDWAVACGTAEWNEWTVPCDKCGVHFTPLWTGERPDGTRWGMLWDDLKDEKGRWKVHAAAKTVRYACPHCGHEHQDSPATKHRWNNGGKYRVVGEGNPSIKLATWNKIPTSSWESLVIEWLNACNASANALELKLAFWNKKMAQNRSLHSLEAEEIHFTRANYEVQPGGPEKDVMRVMSVDKQAMGEYWVLIRDWMADGTIRRVWFGRAYGEGGLDELAARYQLKPNRVVVDANFEGKGDTGVFQMVAKRGWIAVIGADKDHFMHTVGEGPTRKHIRRSYSEPIAQDPGIGTAAQGRGVKACLFYFSAPAMSDCVTELIQSGRWVEPVCNDKDETEMAYRRQMCGMAKRPVTDKVKGRVRMQWVRLHEEHAFDCSKMQCFVAISADRMPDYFMDAVETVEKR